MTSIDRTKSIPWARLGVQGPAVTTVALGTSPLGGMPDAYGYDVPEGQAISTVSAFLESPVNFVDTSNEYTDGESERRIGVALGEGPVKTDIVIATKADPVRGVRDYSGDRVRQSFAESVARLRIKQVDVFYLHDPERFPFSEVTAPGGSPRPPSRCGIQGT